MILAAVSVVRVVDTIRERRWERRAILALTGSALLFVVLSANLLRIDATAARGQYAYRQGVMAESAGRIEEAMSHYREALADDPNLAKANVNLGTLLARQGNLTEALPFLEAGARLDPGSGTALQNLGQAYQVLGRPADALAQFEKAVLAQPELVSARESLAYLRYESGDIKGARQNLQTILLQAPKGTPPALRAGTLLAIMDERTELIGQLRRAERSADADPQWWNHSVLLEADLALAQRRLDDARRGYTEASLNPAVAAYAQNVLDQMTENLGGAQ
jgi:tetratricopeptide (TPR) repeat protein